MPSLNFTIENEKWIKIYGVSQMGNSFHSNTTHFIVNNELMLATAGPSVSFGDS